MKELEGLKREQFRHRPPSAHERKTVYLQNSQECYTFEVHPSANKTQNKEAVESIFKVKVSTVKTLNCFGKKRRTRMGIGYTADWKKAYVTLADGESIEGV